MNHREEAREQIDYKTKANTRCKDNYALKIESCNFHKEGVS